MGCLRKNIKKEEKKREELVYLYIKVTFPENSRYARLRLGTASGTV